MSGMYRPRGQNCTAKSCMWPCMLRHACAFFLCVRAFVCARALCIRVCAFASWLLTHTFLFTDEGAPVLIEVGGLEPMDLAINPIGIRLLLPRVLHPRADDAETDDATEQRRREGGDHLHIGGTGGDGVVGGEWRRAAAARHMRRQLQRQRTGHNAEEEQRAHFRADLSQNPSTAFVAESRHPISECTKYVRECKALFLLSTHFEVP